MWNYALVNNWNRFVEILNIFLLKNKQTKGKTKLKTETQNKAKSK